MSRSLKNMLNFQLILFLLSGFTIILFNDRIELNSAFLIPSFLVFLYGFMIFWGVGDCPVSSLVKQRFDSVYLLGGLYSFISLLVMVFRLKELGSSLPEPYLVAIALSFLAMAVASSVSSIVVRSVFWFRYSKSVNRRKVSRISIVPAGE